VGLRPVCFEFRVSCFTLSHLAVPTVVCDDTTLLLSTSYPLTSALRALVCNVDLFVRLFSGRLVLLAVREGSAPSQLVSTARLFSRRLDRFLGTVTAYLRVSL